MTAKQRLLACFENASDDITVEEAIHRIVLMSNLDRASLDPDEMDQEEFVKELTAEGAFDESPMETRIAN